jgi:hypothetical protein
MDSLFTTFLLFLAAIVAILTYMLIPMASATALVMAAAIALAIGVWWHWTQFAVDYRTATWPEQLRSYSSYVIVLVVILASYGFYTFAWSGSSLQEIAMKTKTAVRNAGKSATNATARSLTEASNTLFSQGDESAANVLASSTKNSGGLNLLANLGGLTNSGKRSNAGNVGAGNSGRKNAGNFLL